MSTVVASPSTGRRLRLPTTFRWRLTLVTLAGLAIRVLYVMFVERGDPLSGDAVYYHEAANLLADGMGFIEPYRYLHGAAFEQLFVDNPGFLPTVADPVMPVGHVEPTAGHPPLWVLVLAAFSSLGISGILGHQLVSAATGAIGVAAIGWAGREVAGDRVGVIAAGLAALHAGLWLNDGLVMSESLTVVMVAALTGLAARLVRSPDRSSILTLGAVGGLAALTRVELLAFLPLAALPVLRYRSLSHAGRWLRFVAVGLVALVVMSPWLIRNLSVFEEPVLLSNGSGILIAQTNCDATYFGDKQGYWEYLCALPQPVSGDGWLLDESERDTRYRRRGLDFAADHPVRLITSAVPKRIGRLWGVYDPVGQLRADKLVEGRNFGLSVLGLVQYYTLLPMAVAGAVLLRRRGLPRLHLLAWPAIVTAVAALTMGTTRYRVPAEVALVLLAAVALEAILDLSRRSRRAASTPPVEHPAPKLPR